MANMKSGWNGKAIIAVMGAWSCLAGPTKADEQVLTVKLPAHPEWCAVSKFDKNAFESPVGQESVMTTGSLPILAAAFKAGAESIGHIYIRSFESADTVVSATFCAAVPPSLQTSDPSVTVLIVPSTELLAKVCPDADQCTADISAALKAEPFKLTDDQIDDIAWRYANAPNPENTVATIIGALNETDRTRVSGQANPAETSDEPAVSIVVAAPKPASVPAR
jgi:hypothetical protein